MSIEGLPRCCFGPSSINPAYILLCYVQRASARYSRLYRTIQILLKYNKIELFYTLLRVFPFQKQRKQQKHYKNLQNLLVRVSTVHVPIHTNIQILPRKLDGQKGCHSCNKKLLPPILLQPIPTDPRHLRCLRSESRTSSQLNRQRVDETTKPFISAMLLDMEDDEEQKTR